MTNAFNQIKFTSKEIAANLVEYMFNNDQTMNSDLALKDLFGAACKYRESFADDVNAWLAANRAKMEYEAGSFENAATMIQLFQYAEEAAIAGIMRKTGAENDYEARKIKSIYERFLNFLYTVNA